MNEVTDTRECILKAAMDRILHYGYGKTTMAEIANDCSMSAGNIYRFFKGKIDIAEAMARKKNAEVYQTYAEIARRSDDPALERLREFFLVRLRRTFQLLEEDDKIMEVANVLSHERPEFANEELAQERIYIVQILEQGIAAKEFRPMENSSFVAEMIQSAMMKFGYPQLWSNLTLEKLEREFHGVFELLEWSLVEC